MLREKYGADENFVRLLTFTVHRDPSDERAHTVEALECTLRAHTVAIGAVWKFLEGRGCVGLYRGVELSGTGHEHVHAASFGGLYIEVPRLAEVYARAFNANNAGTFRYALEVWADWQVEELALARARERGIDVAVARAELRNESAPCVNVQKAKSLREVCKYITKVSSPLDERWLTGEESRECLDPKLAARWDVATRRKHLRQPYGELIGAMKDAEEERHEDADERQDIAPFVSLLPCEHCGAHEHSCSLSQRWVDAASAVLILHELGVQALRGSKWGERYGPKHEVWDIAERRKRLREERHGKPVVRAAAKAAVEAAEECAEECDEEESEFSRWLDVTFARLRGEAVS